MLGSHPNATTFAYVALLLWLPITMVLFSFLRAPIAAAAVVLGGTMFLPNGVGIDLPGIPPLGKDSISILFALVGCLARAPRRIIAARPGRGVEAFIVVLFVAGFFTAATNSDPIETGDLVRPGLVYYDALSMAGRDLLRIALPFFLGRALFRSSRDVGELLVLIAFAGILYAPLIMWEARMSPQLHRDLYGFHQHSFPQAVRGSGYRPMVFMTNGLAVSFLVFSSALAAAALWRMKRAVLGIPAGLASAGLVGVLVLCRSLASVVYGALLVPATLLLQPRTQMRFALLAAIFVLIFPALRISGYFPTEAVSTAAGLVSEKRQQSLEFRFEHEAGLMERALERPLFGWGGFSRNRVVTERGEDTSVTDGFWIIQFGVRGIVGMVMIFLLLLAPILTAMRAFRRLPTRTDRQVVAMLALLIAAAGVDMLPNGLFSSMPYFMAGALFGTVRAIVPARGSARREVRARGPAQPALVRPS